MSGRKRSSKAKTTSKRSSGSSSRKATTTKRSSSSTASSKPGATPYRAKTRKQLDSVGKRSKRGSAKNKTDGAHRLSHELVKHVVRSGPGRPKTNDNRMIRQLDSDGNVRIKTATGNRKTDRRNDQAIMAAYNNGTALRGAAARRAVQAVRGANAVRREHGGLDPTLDRVVAAVGNMKISNGKPGRNPTVKAVAGSS